ncbi:MAG: integrase family protein [Myxococcaceae bacterium]|nr:integrase family protein [Myxococcaceae bacterium]
MATLRRKGPYWYLRDRSGGSDTEIATGCTDRKAAEVWLRQWERDRADPEGAARRAAAASTIQEAVDLEHARHLAEERAGKLASDTVAFYKRKLGVVLDVLGGAFLLVNFTSATSDQYIATRRDDGVSDHTIFKELHALKGALSTARRARIWFGRVDDVMPERFSANYQPRTRFLTLVEVQRVIGELTVDRAGWVALAVGAGAELSALQQAERIDLDLPRGLVRIRGTKNARRDREVPLVLPVCRQLVEHAFAWGLGSEGKLLRPWPMNWRDLQDVARDLEIEAFSLHSLRHTFAAWHLAEGVSWDDVARALGHADTTMLHRLYGHLSGEALRARLFRALNPAETSAPHLPRDGAPGARPARPARSPSNDESPSCEGLSGYRRSELNQRPWDYDSPALTD